ncbi:hypothetical protein N5P37_005599 [Trichoderma harzianum]|nr:hypothetical protein N5P37_005599 [Trichoderma harzianum]
MVRTTIACARCRKAKIKCVHNGSPPCQSCIKEGSARVIHTCTLTRPVIKRKKLPAAYPSTGIPERGSAEHHATPIPRIERTRSPSSNLHEEIGHKERPNGQQKDFVHRVAKAANVFVIQFPELNFLHLPSFLQDLKHLDDHAVDNVGQQESDNHLAKLKGLCFALLALCAQWCEDKDSTEHYISSARSSLSAVDHPDVFTVQTLLVIAMYEWGCGRTYKAWADSGMAIRSAQLLSALPKQRDITELQSEVLNRTFWACFVMDRLVFCGKPQPLALPLRSVDVHWPIGQRDFAFGQTTSRIYPNVEHGRINDHAKYHDLDRVYNLIVQGYDVWSKILQWIAGGGRRRPSTRQQIVCPWEPGSIWLSLYDELQEWRGRHEISIRFPDTALEVHASLGQAHSFAYLNLIYHLCRLFLGREYIPFLPTPTSQPSGPVDPPLLAQEAPSGWWEERSYELFASSAHITDILRRLDAAATPFFTPFSGFCAFSAATMNAYVLYFPRMNLGRSTTAAADFNADRAYLDRFRTQWAIGARWWTAIETIQRLLERAGRDQTKFIGKTRTDFLALEAIINHSASSFPSEEETDTHIEPRDHLRDLPVTPRSNSVNEGLATLAGNHSVSEVMSVRNSTQFQQQIQPQVDTMLYYDGNGNEWNAIWPLWEDQIGVSFAPEHAPWDYAANSASML